MSEPIYWLLALQIEPGQLEFFKAICQKLVESTRLEEGVLNYEWSLSEDGNICHIYERYADSDAIKIHAERVAEDVGQLLQIATPISFVIYGKPDAEVKEMLADLNPTYLIPLAGFTR